MRSYMLHIKHESYFGLLLFLVAFTCCTNNNNKTGNALPVVKGGPGNLVDSCATLKKHGDYSALLVVSKKELASSLKKNESKAVAAFAYFAGAAFEGLKQKDSAIAYYNISERHGVGGNGTEYMVNSLERLSTIYYDEGMADSLTASKNRMVAVADTNLSRATYITASAPAFAVVSMGVWTGLSDWLVLESHVQL